MDKELFKKYFDVQKKIDALEEQKEELRKQLTAELPDDGVDTKYGKFGWMEKRVYTYPAAITEAEAQVKKQKEIAQLNGDATYEVKKSLLVKLV